MINQVTLVGRLTADPDLREIGNGKHVLSAYIAVNRPFKNQNGENEADFVRCTIWNRTAETTAKYCSKGSLVGVTGRIQTRTFEREGKRQYVTEVIAEAVRFLEPRRSSFQPEAEENPTSSDSIHLETIT
ncbi:single-stranded DNA-binding protein [Jeotgalibacillus proteolyticus]|uniref:Single-stranded DNA-binding protein n=1 Tax=Jeotgalibacillus proteolyticus TaxID=2082395 RepID=A0A2S5G996_9BACL|nr:single-stranded DNA-binding protein [Jeotgalibacillus proteolyticus]PPA69566.1 single-stranded DNA-binding protein [Jeotgalibacillus proteolyticus]